MAASRCLLLLLYNIIINQLHFSSFLVCIYSILRNITAFRTDNPLSYLSRVGDDRRMCVVPGPRVLPGHRDREQSALEFDRKLAARRSAHCKHIDVQLNAAMQTVAGAQQEALQPNGYLFFYTLPLCPATRSRHKYNSKKVKSANL